MLFISRLIGYHNYGVVDTDDGVEEVVDMQELYHLVIELGLEIYGVVPSGGAIMENRIFVYQPEETLTQLQLKTMMLKQVHIKVWNNIITSIRWNGKTSEEIVDIRLSDYGIGVADFALARNASFGGYKVNLILDDKVEYSYYAFKRRYYEHTLVGKNGIGVIFDLRELSDSKAEQIYKMLYFDKNEMLGSVHDSAERMDRMCNRKFGG